ncbi:MAG TPA: ATP synthase F1 subunit delta [Pyrinomonadaceae bacterium]|nr:ATP synthase F1 subunit delta [Pyrinomonadaceae bacterium]HNU08322.1 ATP synthase F1 subunit delta [Pyrinomonadaceae bacterium]
MSIETVARRYATALADVVMKTGEIETVKTELKSWEGMISSNGDLQRALSNPAIAHLNKEKVLESLIAKAKPSKTTSNFLRVLLRNNRLVELAQINEKFASVLDERTGVVGAEVVSARELSDAERSELNDSIAKLTGKLVKANFVIDKDIIGGVVTRIGSTVYDNSVKTQLENLKKELIGI